MPMLHDLMEKNGAAYEDLDMLACTVGPGSFTGIRIGVSAVKTMALVLEKPAVPVSSLEAMAWPLKGEDALIVPLIDCRNKRAWAAAYYKGEQVLPEAASDISEIFNKVISYRDGKLSGKKILILGSGAKIFLEAKENAEMESGEKIPLVEYREGLDEIHPENVAAVAQKIAEAEEKAGNVLLAKYPAAALMPVYLSKTQAERTAGEQGKEVKDIPIRYYSTND